MQAGPDNVESCTDLCSCVRRSHENHPLTNLLVACAAHSTSDSCGAMAPRRSRVEAQWRMDYLHSHQAAIDRQIDSSNVAALVGGQEQRSRSNLLRLPDAPHRNRRLEPFLHRICVLAKLT